ncbi:MAG: hypothetical protein WBW62_00020, partial [Solirubrobacterales bacterium]
GTERQVLAARFAKVEATDLGYAEPAVSPDGQAIVFMNRRSGDSYTSYMADVMTANVDGSGVETILASDRNNRYSSPSWTPDGERLIAAYYRTRGNKQTGTIISVKPDGSDRRIIFKLKTRTVKKRWQSAQAVSVPALSPDGSRVLFVRADDSTFLRDGRLEIAELATGKTTLVNKSSLGGDWSPDGTKIVYSERNTGDDEVCGTFGCETSGQLIVADADGTSPRKLLKGNGRAIAPEWSADGSRIVFASNRNMPTSVNAYEIYTVEPDGQCLTWLTNGTPESTMPTWNETTGPATSPGGCGDRERPVLQEVSIPAKYYGKVTGLWLGDEFNGQLYAGTAGPYPDQPFAGRYYTDCANYQPRKCGPGFETLELSICRIRNLGSLVGEKMGKARGVPYFSSKSDGYSYTGVISGSNYFLVLRDSRDGFFSNRQILQGIRSYGEEPSSGKLPPARFPATAIKLMKRVKRVHRRTGSVARTAKVVGIRKKSVKANLKLPAVLRRYGPIKAAKCKSSKKTGERLLPITL